MRDVGRRVRRRRSPGQRAGAALDGPGIVVADELTPARHRRRSTPTACTAIATARGSATVARGDPRPRARDARPWSGSGPRVLAIAEGTPLLLDGDAGTVMVDPDADAVADAPSAASATERRARGARREHAREPAVTRDGTRDRGRRQPRRPRRGAPRPSSWAPTASACCAPSSCSWTATSCPTEDEQARRCAEIARRAGRPAADRPHARRRRRQAAAVRCRWTPRPTRSWAAAGSASALARPELLARAAAGDPAGSRPSTRVQGDVPDGRDARRDRARPRRCSSGRAPDTGDRRPARGRDHGRGARRRRWPPSASRPEVDFFSVGHQRPHAVHDGRRARQRARGRRCSPDRSRRCCALVAATVRGRRGARRAGSACAASWPATRPRRCCSSGLGVTELSMAAPLDRRGQGGAARGDAGPARRAAAEAALRRRRRADAARASWREGARCVTIEPLEAGRETGTQSALRPARCSRSARACGSSPRPVVMALLLTPTPTRAAAILFLVAAATDWFDGRLARRWNVTTKLGSFLDTTADKLLVTGALIALVAVDRVSPWIAADHHRPRVDHARAARPPSPPTGAHIETSMLGQVEGDRAVRRDRAGDAAPRRDRSPARYLDQWAMVIAAVVTRRGRGRLPRPLLLRAVAPAA